MNSSNTQGRKNLLHQSVYLHEPSQKIEKVFLNKKHTFNSNIIQKKSNNKIRINTDNKIMENDNEEKEDNYIDLIINEFIDRNSLIKRANSMPDIDNYSLDDIYNNNNDYQDIILKRISNIDELNNLRETINIDIDKKYEGRTTIFEIDNNITNDNNDEKDNHDIGEQSESSLKSKSVNIGTIMTNDYYEENEHKNTNIKYNNKTNIIENISSNLLLRKIIFENFLKKNAEIIYHFCQQCFCFIDTEVFFGKILNCYNYYRKINTPFEKLKNLIDFLNVLIIEMFGYYKIIPIDKLLKVKTIYNEIISDFILFFSSNHNNEQNLNKKEMRKDENNNDGINSENSEENISNDDNNIFHDREINKNKDINFYEEEYQMEKNEINTFIYNTFFKEIFEHNITQDTSEYYNFSITNINEKYLFNLKNVLVLLMLKKPSYEQILNAKDTVCFYNYLNEEENNQIFSDKNKKKKNDFLHRSYCLTSKERTLEEKINVQRKYLQKGLFCILDWKTEEIGEELIKVTKKLLKKIEKKELYKAIYLKKDKEIKSPNVIENINNFNKLTFFIIEDIISYDHSADRAKIIDKWVQVADYCKSKKDYNDCIAINSALNSYIIKGLTITHKQIKTKTNTLIKSINKFCSCNGNYKYIREEIQTLNDMKEYYYPYLGMMLRDITFLEESSKYLINGELINFEKIEKVHNVIKNNFRFKNVKIRENKTSNIEELKFFEQLKMNSEENLEEIAHQIEPKFKINNGKKVFKRATKIDEKYFNKYKNALLFRRNSNIIKLKK